MNKNKKLPRLNSERLLETDIKYALNSVRIDEVIEFLQNLKTKHSGYDYLSLNIASGYDDSDIEVYGYHKETDEEYTSRVEAINKAEKDRVKKVKQDNDERDLKEYDRLKKKFEKRNK